MRVFEKIFDAEGSEVYLKPASEYVQTGIDMDFYTVLESARRKNEIAIGYRIMAHQRNEEKLYGVVLNPVKSETINLKSEDRIIVLAED